MNAEQLAQQLDGSELRKFQITKEIRELASQNNLIVAYGQSDDLLELDGAVYEEYGAWGGTSIPIGLDGKPIENKCDDEDCPYFKATVESAPHHIKSLWCPDCPEGKEDCSGDGPTWRIETDMPHFKFNIMEDGDWYCEGLVIDLNQLG